MNAITNLTNNLTEEMLTSQQRVDALRTVFCLACDLDPKDEDINFMEIITKIKELKKENEELKEQNEELKEQKDKFKTEYINGLENLQEQLKDKTNRLNKLCEKHLEKDKELSSQQQISFNLEHQLKMVKQSAEYKEYQELFKKKQNIDREYTALKNSRGSLNNKFIKMENENEELRNKNNMLENQCEALDYVNEFFLDNNRKYTKKQLIGMMERQNKEIKLLKEQKRITERNMGCISYIAKGFGNPIHPIGYEDSYPDTIEDMES